MSEEKHLFHLQSVWVGDSEGDGTLLADGRTLEYGLPPQFGGRPGRTNPEELLLSAIAGCYSATLAVLAERRRLPITRIDLSVEGEVVRQQGGMLRFRAIRLAPQIRLEGGDEAQRQAALDAAHKAEQYCMISNAVRGNVELTVTPEIVTG